MAKYSLSGENLSLTEISQYYTDCGKSLCLYFSEQNPIFSTHFLGCTREEISTKLSNHIMELDKMSALNILSALEATFRIDYNLRCEKKMKDELSRKFRAIYKESEKSVSLKRIILESWKEVHPQYKYLISNLIGSFNYRHWLAHGRYWVPKLGREYGYYSLYALADEVLSEIPFVQK